MRGLWNDTRLTFETQTGSTMVSVKLCAEKRDSELPSCANGLNDFVSELVSELELWYVLRTSLSNHTLSGDRQRAVTLRQKPGTDTDFWLMRLKDSSKSRTRTAIGSSSERLLSNFVSDAFRTP